MEREIDWRRRALKAEAEVLELRAVLRQQSDGKKHIAAAVLEANAAQHVAEEWAFVACLLLLQLYATPKTSAQVYQLSWEVPA